MGGHHRNHHQAVLDLASTGLRVWEDSSGYVKEIGDLKFCTALTTVSFRPTPGLRGRALPDLCNDCDALVPDVSWT